jgi:hypothetical protein
MAELKRPIELLDLPDGGSVELSVLRWEKGEIRIETRLEPAGKVVPCLRLWVRAEDKTVGAPYWDITSRTLQARLEPVLDQLVRSRRRIKITKYGVAPTARHQVDFL